MSLWVAVHGVVDGEQNTATVLNRPVAELTERTNYLYNLINSIQGDTPFETVRLAEAPLLTSGANAPVIGDCVSYDSALQVYVKAIATVSSADAFTAANSAYAVGVLTAINGSTGTIVLYGKAGFQLQVQVGILVSSCRRERYSVMVRTSCRAWRLARLQPIRPVRPYT